MNFVKVTSSGQVTLPKPLREKFKTDFFVCELSDGGILFLPVNLPEKSTSQKKYSISDFKEWKFKGKNPKEKTLTEKIDQIVYEL